jgi:hypothetical protein
MGEEKAEVGKAERREASSEIPPRASMGSKWILHFVQNDNPGSVGEVAEVGALEEHLHQAFKSDGIGAVEPRQ